MSVIIELAADGAPHVTRGAPERAAPVPNKPANLGHGDVRKKIVPVVRPPVGPSTAEWEGGKYLSLNEWLEASRREGAILLQPADDVRDLAGKLGGVSLVSVDFHRIGDGRGYTQAFLLRTRLNYQGRIRALGAVTADQIYALARVGFDSFALRADQSSDAAVMALGTFSKPYQGAVVAGSDDDREAANFEARVRLLERALADIAARHRRPALSSSLSAEDMVITDAVARLGLPIDIFTLDTGRLHEETVALIGQTEARYGLKIDVFRPSDGALAAYVSAHGGDGFYEGVAQRKLCCNIRKVEPLGRALKGRDAWLTGQRREQGVTRSALPEVEQDAERGIEKYNPLAAWSWADVLAYARRFNIPMSGLYARGYVSIGCEPCTKPIRPGEDQRAGRWWWESADNRECGLHTAMTVAR